ncbi:unnamed protein product [Dibothriocephalus latus]|uniref:Uncharacterized protein n=1 Tax=Dibothriocephalus latus TaxID=60516 RepID=A0A3P6TLP0_DIBLA|nr:unnamed protein product [Dibothriocephalus latus]
MSDESGEEIIYNAFDAYLNIGRHLIKRKAFARALIYLDEIDDKAEKITSLKPEKIVYFFGLLLFEQSVYLCLSQYPYASSSSFSLSSSPPKSYSFPLAASHICPQSVVA